MNATSQKPPSLPSIETLLHEIIEHVSLVLGQEEIQKQRITALIKLGPIAIRNIEETIQFVAVHGNHDSEFQNAGLLCEAIGKIGGPFAKDILMRFAIAESNIGEYRYIKSSAERALLSLDNNSLIHKNSMENQPQKEETSHSMTRKSIPTLLDIAYKQAEEGECISAVHTYLQAVEIEPRFMMSSLAWRDIASVVTGKNPPGRSKNWITIPKELVPQHVLKQLARLPNESLEPGYPGPYVEPPTETELKELIADLRGILQRYADHTSISVLTQNHASNIPNEDKQYSSEHRNSGVMSDQEMIFILSKLCSAYANNDPVLKELEPIAIKIGEQLNRRGGISEMRRIFEKLGDIRGSRTLDMHWDGIGDWRG